jgi:hypothetical protein
MSTGRRRLIKAGIIVSVASFVIFITRDFWWKLLGIFLLGTLEYGAQEFGRGLHDCDGVEIVAIAGRPGDPDGVAGSFLKYPATARLRLSDEGAQKIVDAWTSLSRRRDISGMCHHPPYGLRFFRGEKLVFETTVCWHCWNYTIPVLFLGRVEYGFEAESAEALALLKLLQDALPATVVP